MYISITVCSFFFVGIKKLVVEQALMAIPIINFRIFHRKIVIHCTLITMFIKYNNNNNNNNNNNTCVIHMYML